MINTYIKIGSNSKVDMYSSYGFIYVSADNIMGAPLKELDKTTYPEEEGEHVYPVAVSDAFDYKVKFLVEGSTITSINGRINTFNNAIKNVDKTLNRVEFYNIDRRLKIVGYPKAISEASDFWYTSKNQKTASAMVELTIRVTKPSLCNFNYSEP